MQPEPPSHFSTILASTIHDMKNSLGILQDRIHFMSTNRNSENPDFMQMEFETNRMNNNMMQLSALYKIDRDQFNLGIDAYPVQEILDDVQAQLAPLQALNTIELMVFCPDELMAFCDYTYICNALGAILNNAQRYSHHQILLTANQDQDYICFSIEDDGEGYSQELLAIDPNQQMQGNWISGNARLGLYFAQKIASMHRNEDKQGFIRIDNHSRMGGARFRLFLPS